MKYYAVIDTNVIVSALLKNYSIPATILTYVYNEKIIPLVNDEILAEYRDVLSRPKFQFATDVIDGTIEEIDKRSLHIDAIIEDLNFDDPDDEKFYALARTMRKEVETYLITGNSRHFPHEFFVVTPRQMLDIIAQDIHAGY